MLGPLLSMMLRQLPPGARWPAYGFLVSIGAMVLVAGFWIEPWLREAMNTDVATSTTISIGGLILLDVAAWVAAFLLLRRKRA